MIIGFTKMHGLGNDFVVINNMNGNIKLIPEQVASLCDRHFGIGADGILLVEPSDTADCFMNYINNDGTTVEMCGNGIRCVAKFYMNEILSKSDKKNTFKIDTRSGIKEIKFENDDTFSVNMGKPVFSHLDFPDQSTELEGLSWNFVSMGNPHAMAFVENIDDYDLSVIGKRVENNNIFPNKINVQLVEEKSKNKFKVKVWERACGITLASGTSACAVYAVARKNRNAEKEVIMHLPGGDIFMSESENGEIIMRGPAESVYTGMVEII